jgi:hypothetical protein
MNVVAPQQGKDAHGLDDNSYICGPATWCSSLYLFNLQKVFNTLLFKAATIQQLFWTLFVATVYHWRSAPTESRRALGSAKIVLVLYWSYKKL